MPNSKRKAPKRKVLTVTRTGKYPSVWWEHRLECGHIERRKRKAPASRVGCEKCAAAMGIVQFDVDAALAEYEAKVAASVAKANRVSPESVAVSGYLDGGYPKVASVTIHYHRDFFS